MRSSLKSYEHQSLKTLLKGLIVLFILGPISFVDTAYGEAFRVLDQSASATGQGSAFAAQADDPSAIHYNPAGIASLERVQLSIGTNLFASRVSYRSTNGTSTKGGFGGTVANPPASNFFLTANLGDLGLDALRGLAVGIGLTSPFGIQIKYPNNSQIAQATSSAALPLIDIKPTLAYEFNQYISVGAGLDIYTLSSLGEGHGEQRITAGAEWAAAPLNSLGIAPGSQIEANGTDTALGFNVGLLLTLWRSDTKPRLRLAFVYRSQVTLDLKGDFIVNGAKFADSRIKVRLPQIYGGGIAFWPIRDEKLEWKTEFDVDFVDWTSFTDLDLRLSNISTLPGVETTLPFPRNYDTATVVVLGTEFKLISPSILPDWDIAFRAGISRSETPVPEGTFSPSVPDSNSHTLSLGAGFVCSKNAMFLMLVRCGRDWIKAIGVDLAFQAVFFETRKIRGTVDPIQRVNGRWKNNVYVGAFNFRVNF